MITQRVYGSRNKVLLIFGGKSTEHQVAVCSALQLIFYLCQNYKVFAIYLNQEGIPAEKQEALIYLENIEKNENFVKFTDFEESVSLMKKSIESFFLFYKAKNNSMSILPYWLDTGYFDFLFPVFHGINGEDGSIQGVSEFFNLPYAGCDLWASAVSIDKEITKQICLAEKIPVLNYLTIQQWEWQQERQQIIEKITGQFPFPLFIKPSRLGSSIGITKAFAKEDLLQGLDLAFCYDSKTLIEPAIAGPREIMVGAMGWQNEILLSEVGEFNYSEEEFFDYEAKYNQESCLGSVPARLSADMKSKINEFAVKIFKAFGLSGGYARLDFFLQDDAIYFNEINTIPSLMKMGTYMRSWNFIGVSYTDFIFKIITYAALRYKLKFEKCYRLDKPALGREI